MTATPRSYWAAMFLGIAIGVVTAIISERSSRTAAEAELERRLTEAFSAERAGELLEMAKGFASGEVKPEVVQKELTGPVREKLDSVGYTDPERLAAPYRNYRDRLVPVALVFALPGALLGLLAAGAIDRHRSKDAPPGSPA